MAATTNSIATDKRDSDNKAAKDAAIAKSASDKKDVAYGKWIKVEYDGSMQKVYEKYQQGESSVPFSNMIVGGTDTSYTSFGSVLLDNNDDIIGSDKSGFFKVVLKDGWMAKIDVRTENENYFYDNITGPTERSLLDFGDSPAGSWDEQISFTLAAGGDYLSIDIDNESSDVGQFTVVIDGTKYTVDSPYVMNNEAKVWLEDVWYFVDNWGTISYTGEDREGADEVTGDDDILPEDVDEDEDDDDDDDDDDGIDLEPTSILLILGLVGGILVGAYFILRGE